MRTFTNKFKIIWHLQFNLTTECELLYRYIWEIGTGGTFEISAFEGTSLYDVVERGDDEG